MALRWKTSVSRCALWASERWVGLCFLSTCSAPSSGQSFSHRSSLAVSTQPCEGEQSLAQVAAVETEAQDRVLSVAELVRVEPGVLLQPS